MTPDDIAKLSATIKARGERPAVEQRAEMLARGSIDEVGNVLLGGWNPADRPPTVRGWYEVRATDNRFEGESRYRCWGCGEWWIPLGKGDGSEGWLSGPSVGYIWRGPVFDVMGPIPKSDTQMIAEQNRENEE